MFDLIKKLPVTTIDDLCSNKSIEKPLHDTNQINIVPKNDGNENENKVDNTENRRSKRTIILPKKLENYVVYGQIQK